MLIVCELKSLGFPKGLAFPVRLATWALLYEADPIELDMLHIVGPMLQVLQEMQDLLEILMILVPKQLA